MSDDRTAIVELIYEYAYRIDAGDLDGVGALFADATYRTVGVGSGLVGGEAIATAQKALIRLYDGSPRTHHDIGNVIVVVDDSGVSATSRSYFTVNFAPPGEHLRVILTGRYEDTFAKADGVWHFTNRLIHLDQISDLSKHLRLDHLPRL